MIKTQSQGLSVEQKLGSMVRVVKALAENETDPLALVCNVPAVMEAYLEDINWIGFYILRGDELVLGPFQGKAACSRIKIGEGVCGTSVQHKKVMLVKDVDEFPGHIACDSASRSELVVPVFKGEEVIAVLDCDSPSLDRFTQAEATAFEQITEFLADYLAQV